MVKNAIHRYLLATVLMITLCAITSACQLFAPKPTFAPTPTFPPFPQSSATFTTTPGPTLTPAPPPMVITRQLKEEGQKTYAFVINYPYLERISDPRFEFFNQQISSMVDKIRQDFIDGMTANVPSTPDPNLAPSFLKTTYAVTHGDNGLLSVIFTNNYYIGGAAHPNQYAATLNLDISSTRVLQLQDLFRPGADYLKFISDYCIQDLKRQNVLEWETGVSPDEQNFRAWNITSGGLLFSFDPYEVASYAQGPQSVTIPYADLQGLLSPSGPLASYLP